jgi:5'-nucleotidase / UDP-sugar diphosphatase
VSPAARVLGAFWGASALLFVACGPTTAPLSPPAPEATASTAGPAASSAAPPSGAGAAWPPATELRILYSSDEHGWIAPFADKGRRHDGAAGLVARYRHEGLCAPERGGRCDDVPVLALSGGDQWTGPAISSFFQGEPAAMLWKKLGFSASALGNHELDFGKEVFRKNQAVEGYPYLAANVSPVLEAGGVAERYRLFKRAGITLGVIGLSTHSTPIHGMRKNYEGLAFADEEEALKQVVPEVWSKGADAVVIIAHVCGDELAPIVERHPEWRLSFVGAGHCHRLAHRMVGDTPVVDPGSFLRSYVRVTIPVDRTLPRDRRPFGARFEVVDLTYPETDSPPVAPDAPTAAFVGEWQQKVDAALGQVVGHTNVAFDPDTPRLTNLITDAWRDATKAEVAVLNAHATRQPIPKGVVTKQSLYSVMPFDNHLVTVQVTGEALLANLSCCEAHVSGVVRKNGRWRLASGAPIQKAKKYRVVTTDFSYTGGSGFQWEKADPKGETTVDWREPVLAWLLAHPTSAAKGLETIVDDKARVDGETKPAASAQSAKKDKEADHAPPAPH